MVLVDYWCFVSTTKEGFFTKKLIDSGEKFVLSITNA